MLTLLLLVPIIGIFIISMVISYDIKNLNKKVKIIALTTSIINLFISLLIFNMYDFSSNLFQLVEECHEISNYEIYLGIDGLSIYFILLTTLTIPVAILSN